MRIANNNAQMTATEMIPAVGNEVLVACESLRIACTIRDVKMSWGRPRLLVQPKCGTGSQWVEMSRVSMPARES